MRFEPEALLMLARRSGLNVWREGDMVRVKSNTPIPADWLETIKLHKPALMAVLNDQADPPAERPLEAQAAGNGENLDMFGIEPPKHAHGKLKRRKPGNTARQENRQAECQTQTG